MLKMTQIDNLWNLLFQLQDLPHVLLPKHLNSPPKQETHIFQPLS